MSKGIQNNRIRTVDIIYTRKGRFYKSINSPKAEITKFALSDDGVDYALYDDNLPDAEKAKKIINTPQFSSWTNDLALMRNKLISRERNTIETPNMTVEPSNLEFNLTRSNLTDIITQNATVNVNFPSPNGFKVTLSDNTYVSLFGRLVFTGEEEEDSDTFDDSFNDNVGDVVENGIIQPTKQNQYSYSEINNGGTSQSITMGVSNSASSSFTIPITYNGQVAPLDKGVHLTVLNVESLDQGITKRITINLARLD